MDFYAFFLAGNFKPGGILFQPCLQKGPGKRRLTFLALFFFILAGCSSLDAYASRQLRFTNYTNKHYSSRPKDYPVELFFKGKPQRQYEVIGEVEGRLYQDPQQALKAKARQVGADALIEIEIAEHPRCRPVDIKVEPGNYPGEEAGVFVPGYSYNEYQVKAKAVRFIEGIN